MKIIYTAKNYSGETKGGEITVKDERDLVEMLRSDGYVITSSKIIDGNENKEIDVNFLDRFFGISIKDKMIFTRNLSVMISSGLPLSRAIGNLSLQTKNKSFSKILQKIQVDLNGGSTLADSLVKYPAIFSELFVNMIRVGEASGNLEEVLEILATQLEKEHDLISKVRGALIYPSVILIAMVGIGILMMIFVVPQITSVFKDMGSTLPKSTQIIIGISNFMRYHYIIFISSIFLVLVGFKVFLSFKSGKRIMGLILIKLPLIGNIFVKVNCARFARIYSSLVKSGVPVIETLKIISRTLTNFYFRKALEKASENIQKGIPLSKIIYEEKKIFPVLVPQMIEVGEETGKTDSVLQKLAEFYEAEIDQITKNLSSIIEPILMIIIGSAVGFFAVSILQPMYSVMETIK